MIIVRQRYYSNLGLEQRNYNIVSDIRHSGIRRAYKKQVGRARKKIAGKIDKSIKKDLIKKENLENNGWKASIDIKRNPIEQDLVKESLKNLRKSKDIVLKEGNLGNSRKENILFIPKNRITSLGELYHEIGHLKISSGKNGKLKKIISDKGQSQENLRDLIMIDSFGNLKTKKLRESNIKDPEILKTANNFFESSSILDSINRLTRGSFLIRDEKNASRLGLKQIKKKLPKNIWKKEKNRQKLANKSYMKSVSISSKIPIRNKVQIPSRRGEFN